ncbi:MAG: FapA family protein [Tissierellia bacterium]|nr:FapA family protein [Tissierellia bacterium]
MDNINNINQNKEQTENPVDAVINVSISSNKLEASIYIEAPKYGGLEADYQSIKSALDNANVNYGINDKLIHIISKTPQYRKYIIIAQGISSINGKDGTFKLLFNTSKDFKPKTKKDGSVDFQNLETVESVSKGQILCEITHPVEGKDGMTVTGQVISFAPGKAVPSLLGKNTSYNEDKTAIRATTDGQVDFSKGKIDVNETFYISQNVDNSTGNIRVIGNVIVNGTILPGFSVEAGGNIEVKESVCSVDLKAGGNVVLRRGAITSKIACNGDLTSNFIENCNAFVKGDIKATYIMNSRIKCGNNIQTIGAISKIVGGNYVAGGNIESRTIGSTAGVQTFMEIGTDPETIDRQHMLLKELPELEKKFESLKSLIYLLQQYEAADRLTLEKKEMLRDATFSYNKISNTITSGKKELAEISEIIRAKGYGRIISRDTIYPGTTVKIGSRQMTVNEPLFNKSLYYTDEGIGIGFA